MSFFTIALLTVTLARAHASYLVELAGGDRVTVETYWRDGEQVHLVSGGVDRIVAGSEVGTVRADGETERVPAHVAPAPRNASAADPVNPAHALDDAALAAKQVPVERRLLRAQQARFEARARGDAEAETAHLTRAFEHAQERRHELIVERARRER